MKKPRPMPRGPSSSFMSHHVSAEVFTAPPSAYDISRRHGIDALTIEVVPPPPPPPSSPGVPLAPRGARPLGGHSVEGVLRAVESTLRSLNNLEQRLHHVGHTLQLCKCTVPAPFPKHVSRKVSAHASSPPFPWPFFRPSHRACVTLLAKPLLFYPPDRAFTSTRTWARRTSSPSASTPSR